MPSINEDDQCESCLHRYEGRTTGTDEEELTGYGLSSASTSFFFINGQLQKYNDADADNNEMTSYNSISEKLMLNYKTTVGREIRAFGKRGACDTIQIYTGTTDETTTQDLIDLGIGTLGNIFVFINGSLQVYNDSDTSSNQIISYDADTETIELSPDNKPTEGREIRGFKLTNE